MSALSYAPGARLELWPARHLLAKDILRFHCVYWPALLISAGYEVPRQLFVHGYLNLDGRGISKSLGNVIRVEELTGVYQRRRARFWAARAVTLGQDADVTAEGFHERYERELARTNLGNLLSRTTALIARSGGSLAEVESADGAELAAAATALGSEVAALFDRYEITTALDRIWDHVRRLNRFVEQTKPWELARDPERGRGSPACSTTSRTASASSRWRSRPCTSRRRRRGSCAASGSRSTSPGRTSLLVAPSRRAGSSPREPLFPRVDAPAAAA